MGVVKAEKMANGQQRLEITYGGREAPFGGIDSSKASPYIDPMCAEDIQGFIIAEGEIVAVSLKPLSVTITLPGTGFDVTSILSGFGNFYTLAGGYQNFCLVIGNTTTDGVSNFTNLAFYVWPANDAVAVPTAQTFIFTQPLNSVAASKALCPLPIHSNYTPPAGAPTSAGTFSLIISYHGTVETYGPYASTMTPTAMATAVGNDITSRPSTLVTCDGVWLANATLLKAATAGAVENAIIATVVATPATAGAFITGTVMYPPDAFFNGTDAYAFPAAQAPFPLSYVSEGETLYIAGPGTGIFQYSQGTFSLLTQYLGANVLKKFAGSLIALGIQPGPSTVIQSPEMVIAWSAASEFGVWNPIDAAGNITGAGFEQLADIEDYLTGGFVSNSVLTILRAKGISYASALGDGSDPFQINHVDLAPEGDGCQDIALNSQFGGIGFYVGTSNIYAYSGGPNPIGDKIKSYLFDGLYPSTQSLPPGRTVPNDVTASKALALLLNGDTSPYYFVLVKPFLYVFSVSTQVWTRIDTGILPVAGPAKNAYLGSFPLSFIKAGRFQSQGQLVVGFDNTGFTFGISFFMLDESVPQVAVSQQGANPFILFPQEEIALGRDIQVDGVLAFMAGTPGLQVLFEILDLSNEVILSYTFTFGTDLDMGNQPAAGYETEHLYRIYFDQGIMTCRSPQLRVTVLPNEAITQFRMLKTTLFATFDPSQSPVSG